MKRTRKTNKKDLVEESTTTTDSSDTDEVLPATMKKGKAKKIIQLNQEESSDSEDTLKLPLQNVKKMYKPVESSDCISVAWMSNSDSEEIPSRLKKKKRVKKAMKNKTDKPNSDTANSLLPVDLLQRGKKRITRKSATTTAIPENSDTDEVLPAAMKKGKAKKIIQLNQEESSDSDDNSPNLKKKENTEEINKEEIASKESGSNVNPEKESLETNNGICSSDISETESEPEPDTDKHMEDIEELQRLDPEFYNFLKQHDAELLDFDEDEDDILDSAIAGKPGADGKAKEKKKEADVNVPGKLHAVSDESDSEAENARPVIGAVTHKMVNELEVEFQKSEITLSTIAKAVKHFHGAVARVTSEDGTTEGDFKVAGSSVFNSLLNLCVLYMPKAIEQYLGMEKSGKDPQKCKHFDKIKKTLIDYLTDLLELLGSITSVKILLTMLKHLHQVSKYMACVSTIAKTAIKRLLPLWSAGDETVRVLAFMCILRITRNHEMSLLVPVLKVLFMTYVRNCKLVSPSTWPGINFMRRSLVEMFTLDLERSYPQVVLYVRQLGIHLRNAIVVPKAEHRMAVFNWQFINAVHLWSELVSQNMKHTGLQSLHFTLVMIISNTIKLGCTPQYYPLRFHLIEVMMKMEQASKEFIPIMPYFMDVINKFDINKKHKKASMKPLEFSCIIRLSKSQMSESGFKDAVAERLYALLLEFTATMSYKMVFPDCCVVLILFFREFVDKCNNPKHKKKLKQLLDKILENNEYMNKKRFTFDGHLAEVDSIIAWEKQIKAQGTPLLTYFESWSKQNKIQKRKNVTQNDEMAGLLPLIKRPKIVKEIEKELHVQPPGPVNIFPSDSEDDDDLFRKEVMIIADEENIEERQKKTVAVTVAVATSTEDDELEPADTGDVVSEFTW